MPKFLEQKAARETLGMPMPTEQVPDAKGPPAVGGESLADGVGPSRAVEGGDPATLGGARYSDENPSLDPYINPEYGCTKPPKR